MAGGEADFSIVYDGETVQEGSIDARQLAPALLALADVIDEAQPLISELEGRISLRVRSDFERGSFEVHLEIAKLYTQFKELFSGSDATAFANLFQIVGIAGFAGALGLFPLIKKAKRRKSTSITVERSERVQIVFEGDEEPVVTDRRTLQLFQNLRVRKAVEQIITPLMKGGIDRFEIKHRGRSTFEVSEQEAQYFVAPTEHEGETASALDTRVSIVVANFQQGNKWRVSDGSRTIYVAIEDTDFVRAVQTGQEAFRKGDILHVRLQTRQWMEGGELRAEFTILKVYDHEPGPRNLSLLPKSDADSES